MNIHREREREMCVLIAGVYFSRTYADWFVLLMLAVGYAEICPKLLCSATDRSLMFVAWA